MLNKVLTVSQEHQRFVVDATEISKILDF